MTTTYRHRRNGRHFKLVTRRGEIVYLRALDDNEQKTIARTNLLKTYARVQTQDYRVAVEITPEPVRVGDRLPGPNPAPRPVNVPELSPLTPRAPAGFKTSEGEHPAPASSTSRDALVRGGEPPGEAKAPSSRPSEESFKGDYPWSQPIPDAPVRIVPPPLWRRELSLRDRADLRWFLGALVLSALFVVVMWIAVLS